MPRYEHFLAPAKGASFPSQVVAVECVGLHRPLDSVGTLEIEELSSWHCATMKGSQGTYGKVKTWLGESSQSFWQSLIPFMGKTCQTYLLLWRAQRILSLLNYWRKLEEGSIALHSSASVGSALITQRWGTQSGINCVVDDPPTVIECRMDKMPGRLMILDVRNFGIDRDTLPDDPSQWTVEILLWFAEASRQLIRHGLGGWKSTAASQAMYSWRYGALQHTVLCHTVRSALELERKAYYGGRCECFRIGTYVGPIYHLDFRSLYPYCSQDEMLPVRLVGSWRDIRRIPRDAITSSSAIIADVTLRTDSPDYPVRHEGRIIWPVGRFRTALCGPELRDAEQSQRIDRYHSIALYEVAPALRLWVDRWYAIRQHADRTKNKLLGSWAKRVLVSLVGKLGQKEPTWKPAPNIVPDCPWQSWYGLQPDGSVKRYRCFNWDVAVESIAPNSPDAVPAMAAWITSAARLRLLNALRIAGRENVYYCDTDSLICNAVAHLRLYRAGWLQRGRLGYLQERGIHQSGTFINVKHYALDGEIKCSGMPQGLQTSGPTAGTLWYQLHCASALRKGQMPGAVRQLRTYSREDVYAIGHVTQSGDVLPLKIGG